MKNISLDEFVREMSMPGVIEAHYVRDKMLDVRREIDDIAQYAKREYKRGNPLDLEALGMPLKKIKYLPEYDGQEAEDITGCLLDGDGYNQGIYRIAAKPSRYQSETAKEEALRNVTSVLPVKNDLYLVGPNAFLKIDQEGKMSDLYGSLPLESYGDKSLHDYFNSDGGIYMRLSDDGTGINFYKSYNNDNPFLEDLSIRYNIKNTYFEMRADMHYWFNTNVYGA